MLLIYGMPCFQSRHSSIAKEDPVLDWLKKPDWRKSPPHLLLLSKFLGGDSPSRYVGAEHWQSALKEDPIKVIRLFIDDKALEPASLFETMDVKYKATELRDLLKARQQKVSGRKPELIARLMESDKKGMVAATRDLEVLKCSTEATRLAKAYLEGERQRREAMANKVFRLLESRDYANATQAVATFEATRVFPRGIGIDWNNYNSDSDVTALKVIFERTPQLLTKINGSHLDTIRLAAGMMQLCGTNAAAAWLPKDFSTGIHLETDSAARMLIFHAAHLRNMEQYNEAGVKTVKISGVGDNLTCNACRDIDGKQYATASAPELPYYNCTCEIGCRCLVVAEDFH